MSEATRDLEELTQTVHEFASVRDFYETGVIKHRQN